MIRKTQLTPLILLLISSASWAAQGFYVGAGLGPETVDFKQAARVLHPGDANVKDTTHLSGTGIFGSLFAGYSWNRQRFYLAGEVNANMSSVAFNSSNFEFIHQSFSNTNYKIERTFGISLLPGFLYTNSTLFYGRAGYANGKFKTSTSDTTIAIVDRNLDGFRFGFGVNQAIGPHVAARLEYSHIDYQRTKFRVIDGVTTKTTSISPYASLVEFGLVYNFC